MKRLLIFPLAVSLVLPGCATIQRATATIGTAINAVQSVRSNVSRVLSSPAPLANTQRDEELVRAAYTKFGQGLRIIESLVDRGVITPGSPNALRIDAARVVATRELRRAYDIQRGLNTGTVKDALANAAPQLDTILTALQQER